MACTGCAKQFGFFTKEHGCPVCKFSFCTGCLKHKLVREGKKLTVCLRCSKLSVVTNDDFRQHDVPQAVLVKPSPGLHNDSVAKVPIITSATDESQTNEDETIRSRLATLKTVTEDDGASAGPSQHTTSLGPQDTIDIEKRLAALKGTEYKDAAMRKAAAQRFMAPDHRTEQQKVQDLIGQYVAESKLDEVTESRTTEQDEEIVRRLNALKEIVPPKEVPARSDDSDSDTDSMKDEKLARKLAEQYAEEAKIHRRARMDSSSSESLPDDTEDPLPWCTICNEDAVLQCKGCDGDLYCTSCYDEFHYDDNRGEHPTVPFRKKRQVKAK
uniref:FYVE-type domain-containing protein n=1 Tax=Anopheles triannulatus TaxID=58253 RepID=A0A2M4AV19_9DIPT